MKIRDLSQYGEDFTKPLTKLYDYVGNTPTNGFLGEDLHDVFFDEEGRIHYSTHKETEDTRIDSNGVVLGNSVLVGQTQNGRELTVHRIYSWDIDSMEYTMLEFDNSFALNHFFNTITRCNANLCDKDITLSFREMGLTLESVTNIVLNQKANPMDKLFDMENEGNIDFTR